MACPTDTHEPLHQNEPASSSMDFQSASLEVMNNGQRIERKKHAICYTIAIALGIIVGAVLCVILEPPIAKLAMAGNGHSLGKMFAAPVRPMSRPFYQQERPADYKFLVDKRECAGCGADFHSESPSAPGYLPADFLGEFLAKHDNELAAEDLMQEGGIVVDRKKDEEEEEDKPVFCQRCFRLRNYGEIDEELRPGWSRDETLMPAHFEKLIGALQHKKCILVTVVDVFDFHGSILPDIAELAEDNPVIVAVNKVDLLPLDFDENRVRSWIRAEAAKVGLTQLGGPNIHLVSAKTGMGVDKLLDTARKFAVDRECDIYVVGAANVGKSSLLNRICDADGGQNSGRQSKTKKNRVARKPKRAGITASSLPGTTLNFVKIGIGRGVKLVDTPGLILPHQLTLLLKPSELKQVIPHRRVNHATLKIGEGKTVLFGGLARFEILHGLPFFLTFFMADGVKIHPMPSSKRDVDEFVRSHVGSVLTPPSDPERLDEIGELESHELTIKGAGWLDAACDVVLAGLGWVSFTGVGTMRIKVSVPKGIMVLQRDPLMPSEARDTIVKNTGGHMVRPRKKKQIRSR